MASLEPNSSISIDDCWNRVGVWRPAGDACPRLGEVRHCRNCERFVAAGRALLERAPPPGYLEECAEALAAKKDSTPRSRGMALSFRLGDEWLAFPGNCLQKVVNPRPPHSIPRLSNQVFLGLVNVDGELVPCFSLRQILNIGGGEFDSPAAKMLVLNEDGAAWIFPVDELGSAAHYHEGDIAAAAALGESAPKFVRLMFRSSRVATIGLLAPELVLDACKRSLGQCPPKI